MPITFKMNSFVPEDLSLSGLRCSVFPMKVGISGIQEHSVLVFSLKLFFGKISIMTFKFGLYPVQILSMTHSHQSLHLIKEVNMKVACWLTLCLAHVTF